MKEENNRDPKGKWSRIFQKKWFFPALYLSIAVVFLAGIVWYQNVSKEVPDADDGGMEDYDPDLYDEDARPVTQQEEVIRMPVADEDTAEIVTTFYDYDAPTEERENSLVHYNNRYYQNEGVAIASTEETSFDVLASFSGTVETIKEDPLLGNLVTLSHGDDTMTYYASLEEIIVKEGQKIEQGDVIGSAGQNLFGQENGIHVHFEIVKNGEKQNPETLFDQPVSTIGSTKDAEKPTEADAEAEDEADVDEEEEDETEEDEAIHQDEPADEDDDEEKDEPDSEMNE